MVSERTTSPYFSSKINQGAARTGYVRTIVPRPSLSFTRGRLRSFVLFAALSLWATQQGCSRARKHYQCSERTKPSAACSCSEVSRASDASPCKKKYDCCVEYASNSFMYDNPHRGSGCACWILDPGETCERTSRSHENPGVSLSYPPSCPPP